MKTWAYCAAEFQHSVRKAAGVVPLLSPPATAKSFDPRWLEGRDFLYLKLHGLPEEVYWYGDNWITALRATQILAADLRGATVFVANCHLYQTGNDSHPTSPMLNALLAAGARAVVGGSGENYAKRHSVHGADRLGRTFRRLLQLHFPPYTAFRLAQLALLYKPHKDPADLDALNFRYFGRG
jgi:hypothetical protein